MFKACQVVLTDINNEDIFKVPTAPKSEQNSPSKKYLHEDLIFNEYNLIRTRRKNLKFSDMSNNKDDTIKTLTSKIPKVTIERLHYCVECRRCFESAETLKVHLHSENQDKIKPIENEKCLFYEKPFLKTETKTSIIKSPAVKIDKLHWCSDFQQNFKSDEALKNHSHFTNENLDIIVDSIRKEKLSKSKNKTYLKTLALEIETLQSCTQYQKELNSEKTFENLDCENTEITNLSLENPVSEKTTTNPVLKTPIISIEKLYWCAKCQKKFKSSQILKNHSCIETVESFSQSTQILKNYFQSQINLESLNDETSAKENVNTIKKLTHSRRSIIHSSNESIESIVPIFEEPIPKKDSPELHFNCDVCSATFKSKRNLRTHVSRHLYEKLYPCEKCGKRFIEPSILKIHMAFHTGDRPFDSGLFKTSYRNASTPKENFKKESNKPYQCKICFMDLRRRYQLKSHMLGHLGIKPFECNICNQRLSTKSALRSHMTIHNNEKPFSCDICSKAFRKLDYLKLHKRIHLEKRPYQCDLCDKGYSRSYDLKCHMSLHTGLKPLYCLTCKKGFNRKDRLSKHVCFSDSSEPYETKTDYSSFNDIYDKSCRRKPTIESETDAVMLKNLKKKETKTGSKIKVTETKVGEIAKDTNTRPFKCEFCESTFTLKGYLDCHERIHNEKKPFNCGICKKMFIGVQEIKSHVVKCNKNEDISQESQQIKSQVVKCNKKKEISQESYKCSLCTQSFTKESYLKIHEDNHKKNEYRCCICYKGFQSNHLRKHFEEEHENYFDNESRTQKFVNEEQEKENGDFEFQDPNFEVKEEDVFSLPLEVEIFEY